MAIIPRANPASVSRIDGLPSARNAVQVSSEPAEAMGRAVQGLGEVANKIYQQKVEENSAAALMDARRQYQEWDDAQFNPENPDGIDHYQGRDALQAERDLIPASRQRLDEIGASLPPALRQRWNEIAFQADAAFGDRVRRTAYQRHDQWQQFTRKSAQDALANSAAVAIGTGDAATFQPKLDEASAVFEQNLRLTMGADADVSEASRQFRSGVITSGINQALARNDFTTARALLSRFQPVMNADDVVSVQRAIVPYIEADQYAEAWADVLAGGEAAPAGASTDSASAPAAPPTVNGRLPGEHLARGQQFYSAVEGILKPYGARVTSTTGDEHNVGSLHPSGAAMDIGVKEFDPARQEALLTALRADPRLYVVDERQRPRGQAVWSAPHFHVEIRGARANRGGSVDGPVQPRGAPPANLTEAIARIRARFPTDRRMQDGVIGLAQRYFQEQDLARRDQMEAITLKINRSAPGADLTTVLTPAEQGALRDSGHWDEYENSQRNRVVAGMVHDDPNYVSDNNEAILRDPVAWARNFDPNSIENRRLLSQASRSRLGELRDKIRNEQTRAATISRYGSQAQAMDAYIFRPLGLIPSPSNPKGDKDGLNAMRAAVQRRWFSVEAAWAQEHPNVREMPSNVRDDLMRNLASEYAIAGVSSALHDPDRRSDYINDNYGRGATPQSRGGLFGENIPESARRQIQERAMRDMNLLLNERQVEAIYFGEAKSMTRQDFLNLRVRE